MDEILPYRRLEDEFTPLKKSLLFVCERASWSFNYDLRIAQVTLVGFTRDPKMLGVCGQCVRHPSGGFWVFLSEENHQAMRGIYKVEYKLQYFPELDERLYQVLQIAPPTTTPLIDIP